MRGLRRFFTRWQNIIGSGIVLFYIAVAVAAPRLAPRQDSHSTSYFQQVGRATDHTPHPPGLQAFFGTLNGQYDIYFTVIWGTRQALTFGVTVVLLAASFGVLYGASSAYFGGWVGGLLMRISDAFLAFPVIAGIVFISQIFMILLAQSGVVLWSGGMGDPFIEGAQTPLQILLLKADPVLISLVLFSWMPYTRVTYAAVLRYKDVDYVQAARALGAGHTRIILRHLLPNSISPAIVFATRDIGAMVVLQATFTYIGLGGNSPWGAILALGKDWVIGPGGNPFIFWWTFVPGTVALTLFSIGWNMLGDGLNDAMNIRQNSP